VKDESINDETCKFVGGEPSFLFNNGVPPMSCNTLLLALAYKACTLVRGTIEAFYEKGKCVIVSSWFVDLFVFFAIFIGKRLGLARREIVTFLPTLFLCDETHSQGTDGA
jgi:hypothetical protein